jgi:hypothetical protein
MEGLYLEYLGYDFSAAASPWNQEYSSMVLDRDPRMKAGILPR